MRPKILIWYMSVSRIWHNYHVSYLIKRKNNGSTNNMKLSPFLMFYSEFKSIWQNFEIRRIVWEWTATITDSAHFAAIKLKRAGKRAQSCKNTPSTSIGFRYLHFRGGYIKGNLRGGNWVQILREVEFIREGRGRRDVGEGGGERVESLSAAIHQSVESIRWN